MEQFPSKDLRWKMLANNLELALRRRKSIVLFSEVISIQDEILHDVFHTKVSGKKNFEIKRNIMDLNRVNLILLNCTYSRLHLRPFSIRVVEQN